ncbi:TRM11 family SAM-dependent methyltransferase [Brachybacterium sp. AOP25-B2-12]|uniref:TRM11 family SAM-dependent methyltransferase n=1 Tax=Brachybacterium sp. AOP25-B2-12 TaxID=3457710 RepID=UPI0040332E55
MAARDGQDPSDPQGETAPRAAHGEPAPRAAQGADASRHVPQPQDGDAPTPAVRAPEERLLVLRAPSSNRVYADASGPLAVHEARRVLAAHLDPGAVVELIRLGGIEYLDVRCRARREDLVRVLSTLSGVLGAFAPHEHGDADAQDAFPHHPAGAREDATVPAAASSGSRLLLEPLAPIDATRLPSDLETTLRYPGKTNEQFTALLVNLATASSGRRAGLFDGSLQVLDPVCGRGTTLSRALRLGLDVVGADVDKADIEAYRAFLLTWMRTHHLKHTSDTGRLSTHGRVLGTRFEAELARSKEDRRAGRIQHVTLLRCPTEELASVLPRGAADALVADLPYGVQHGAHRGRDLERSPLALLTEAAPVWRGLLRRDAGMALAINRHTTPYAAAADILNDAGFRVLGADGEFRHRVDQSIDRDVLVAVRTDHPQVDDPALSGAVAVERIP